MSDARPTDAVALVCPSLGRACGIARYTDYVAEALRRQGLDVHVMAETAGLIAPRTPVFRTVLVQHEYGLFDHFSPLGRGESTAGMLHALQSYRARHPGSRTAIVMHTVKITDHVLNMVNTQLFGSAVPIFTLNSRGAYELGIPFLEHGVHRIATPTTAPTVEPPGMGTRATIGSFGLLSPNKRPNALIELCAAVGAGFVGNFATDNPALAQTLATLAAKRGVPATVAHDFCDEPALAARLAPMHMAAAVQDPIGHFATSGSIRFLVSLGRPVLAPWLPQFADCAEALVLAQPDEMAERARRVLTDPAEYAEATARARRFAERHEMGRVYAALIDGLHSAREGALVAGRRRLFRSVDGAMRPLTPSDLALLHTGLRPAAAEAAIVGAAAEAAIVGAAALPCAAMSVVAAPSPGGQLALSCAPVPAEAPRVVRPIARRRGIDDLAEPADRLSLLTDERETTGRLAALAAKARSTAAPFTPPVAQALIAAADAPALARDPTVAGPLIDAAYGELCPALYAAGTTAATRHARLGIQASRLAEGCRGQAGPQPWAIALVALPAAQVAPYMMRVGGWDAASLLAALAAAGRPADQMQARCDWLAALALWCEGRDVPAPTLAPPRLRGRRLLFATELACLDAAGFALAMTDLFLDGRAEAPAPDALAKAARQGRRAVWAHLAATDPLAVDIALIDADVAQAPLPTSREIAAVHAHAALYRTRDASATAGDRLALTRALAQPCDRSADRLAEAATRAPMLLDIARNDFFEPRPEGRPTRPALYLPAALAAMWSDGGAAAGAPEPDALHRTRIDLLSLALDIDAAAVRTLDPAALNAETLDAATRLAAMSPRWADEPWTPRMTGPMAGEPATTTDPPLAGAPAPSASQLGAVCEQTDAPAPGRSGHAERSCDSGQPGVPPPLPDAQWAEMWSEICRHGFRAIAGPREWSGLATVSDADRVV
ncbi:MAG: hypothetical protein AAF677_03660, partial [Pseudomonadota bacterium]